MLRQFLFTNEYSCAPFVTQTDFGSSMIRHVENLQVPTLTGAVHGLPAGNVSGLSTHGLPTHGLSAAHYGAHDLHAHSLGRLSRLTFET